MRNQEPQILESLKNYFLEKHMGKYANALTKAASYVVTTENNRYCYQGYDRKVHTALMECLHILNCDSNCPDKLLVIGRELLERYNNYTNKNHLIEEAMERDYYSDNLDYDIDEIMNGGRPPMDSDNGIDDRDRILNNTTLGDTYDISDFGDGESDDSSVEIALKGLIKDGHFEVLERDEYNGKVKLIQRIK